MGAKRSFDPNSLESLAEKADYNAKKLARLCGLSPRQFERVFQTSLKSSPQRWLNELKIFKAQELLLVGRSVKEISFELGYKHTSYFCYQFKYVCGLTPTKFRIKQIR